MKRALAVASLIACGGSASRPMAPPPRPIEAPPAERGKCTIAGDGEREFGGVLHLYTAYDAEASIATLQWLHRQPLTWSALPPPGRGERARVAYGGQKVVRFQGWASISDRSFTLLRRADVHRGHLWLRKGSPVSVHGEAPDGALVVSHVHGSFTDREYYAHAHQTRIGCADVAYTARPAGMGEDDAPPVDENKPAAIPEGNEIHVSGEPRGPVLFTLGAMNMGLRARRMDESDGWVHVAGGDHLAFDGWVPAAELTKKPRTYDWEHSSYSDEQDRCPDAGATVARDASVWVGTSPSGAPQLVAEAGARIDLVDARTTGGEFAAFVWRRRDLEPPRGLRFYIRRSDLDAPSGPDEDGCPAN